MKRNRSKEKKRKENMINCLKEANGDIRYVCEVIYSFTQSLCNLKCPKAWAGCETTGPLGTDMYRASPTTHTSS